MKVKKSDKDMQMFENYLTQYRMLIAGATPIIGSGPYARPAEIRSWLACRPDVENFVILDDDERKCQYSKKHFIVNEGINRTKQSAK